MNTKISALIMSIFFLTLETSVSAADPRIITSKPDVVFAPGGFDNNDNIQITLAAHFISLCDRVGPTKFHVDQLNHKIYIQNQTYITSEICSQIALVMPYTVVVNIGVLPAGQYEIFTQAENQTYAVQGRLSVKKADPNDQGPDHFHYAPISDVSFVSGADGKSASISIKGIFSNSCLSLGSIIVNQDIKNIVDILPISQELQDPSTPCSAVATPFSATVQLDPFPEGTTLIHVLSANGQAINKVITALDR